MLAYRLTGSSLEGSDHRIVLDPHRTLAWCIRVGERQSVSLGPDPRSHDDVDSGSPSVFAVETGAIGVGFLGGGGGWLSGLKVRW